ncbi:hypothetical protein [Anditalea andensis]|uniref:HTTM domain-containing protein n=1 Tax=Anditalea andensis TaxID=1048983 RepID=A0A074KT56_9BACT|nr:hypothetical protein [Anditalea andensis]KEO73111.1 hypothetical protein EL17_16000 [Anditalea andensis]
MEITAHQYDNIKNVNREAHTSISIERYQIFCILYVIATFFHLIKNREMDSDFSMFILTLSGVFLLFKPKSILRFTIFLLLQLLVIFIHMPLVSNHWIFTAFVSATILQALLVHIFNTRSFEINRGDLYETFAPVVRIQLLILYFFVVFHKLNYDFFNIDVSCATMLMKETRGMSLLPLSPAFYAINAYFTIFIELLIPLLLVFRKTRNTGVLIGLCFHNVIAYSSYNGFYDFSSMIFALYFLFADDRFTIKISNTLQHLNEIKQNIADKITLIKNGLSVFNFYNFTLITSLILGGLIVVLLIQFVMKDYVLLLWAAYSCTFIVFYLIAIRKSPIQKYDTRRKLLGLPYVSLAIIPILVIINGMSPYLGLKTENSFAMFSNLRTEGGISNHFFMTPAFQLFDYQKDLVEITHTSDPVLQKSINNNQLITFFDLKQRVSIAHPKEVDYIYKNEYHTFRAGGPDTEGLLNRNPLLLRKILRFRPIDKSGNQSCGH